MAKGQVGTGQYGIPQGDAEEGVAQDIAAEMGSAPLADFVEYEDEDGEMRQKAAPYPAPRDPADEILKGIKRSEKTEKMLLTGRLEEDFLIFGGRMKIRIRTLPVGEKAKVALAVEEKGSMLGLQSYHLLTLMETFARAITAVDGEPVAPVLEDEQYVDPDEQYVRNRRVIAKWNEEALLEIYDNAWKPLLQLETDYFEEAKKG